MPRRGTYPILLCLAAFTACAGLAPDPSAMRAEDLPIVELDDEQRQQCTRDESLAIAAVLKRHYIEAGEAAVRVLAVDPRAARSRAVLGMVHMQLANEQDPIEWAGLRAGESEIALALQLAPNDAWVGWIHAVFLAEIGHMSAAADAAEAALERAKDAPAAERESLLITAGRYRYELGEERAALPHLQSYLALRPDHATAHFSLGDCLLRISQVPKGLPDVSKQTAQRQAERAAVAFARCYELAPGDEDAALAVAAALLRAADLAGQQNDNEQRDAHRVAAVEHLRKVAETFDKSPESHYRLGVIATMQSQPEAARAAYVAALERDPAHVDSMLNLAAMIAGDERDAAKTLLQRALAIDDESRVLSRDERKRIERWLAEKGA